MMTEQEIKDKINQLVVFWEKDYREREKSNSVGDALSYALWELAEWMLDRIKSKKISNLVSKVRLDEVVKNVMSELNLDKYLIELDAESTENEED